jgi:hypothetical protein
VDLFEGLHENSRFVFLHRSGLCLC